MSYGISYCEPRWDAWKDTYDAWKTRSPDEGRHEPPCELCGSTWEDEGQDWAVEWIGDVRIIAPFGWCRECGWRCEPCPDIEDAYERTDIEFITEGCINAEPS